MLTQIAEGFGLLIGSVVAVFLGFLMILGLLMPYFVYRIKRDVESMHEIIRAVTADRMPSTAAAPPSVATLPEWKLAGVDRETGAPRDFKVRAADEASAVSRAADAGIMVASCRRVG